MSGYILIHRKICKSGFYTERRKFSKFEAWFDMLMLAQHTPSVFYKNGHEVALEVGQLGRSEVELSDRWQWSRTKTRTFLKNLESSNKIIQQKNSVTSVISITNYESYQKNEQPKNIEKTSRKHRENIKKTHTINVNEFEPMLSNEINAKHTCFTFDEFWDAYGKKVDSKKCKDKYDKISEEKRLAIKENVFEYVKSTPDVKFRKNPLTYLNGECWNDALIQTKSSSVNASVEHKPFRIGAFFG